MTGETGFRCPVCGQTAEFTAFEVVLKGETRITADGWDYISEAHDVDLARGSRLRCPCGYEGLAIEFGL